MFLLNVFATQVEQTGVLNLIGQNVIRFCSLSTTNEKDASDTNHPIDKKNLTPAPSMDHIPISDTTLTI